jgi:hypothetical protein
MSYPPRLIKKLTLHLALVLCTGVLHLAFAREDGHTNVIEPRDNYIYELEHWRVREADSTNVETGADSAWVDLGEYRRSAHPGLWWIETRIILTAQVPGNKYLALYPDRIVAACDVYWDGEYVGSNGTVGAAPAGEQVGRYFNLFLIPHGLTAAGEHRLRVHISNWTLRSHWEQGQLFFGYYDSLLKLVFAWQLRIYFLLGIIFLALCLGLFLTFTSQQRRSSLLFSLLCVFIFLSLVSNYFWAIADVGIGYVDIRNLLVPILVMCIGIAIPVFLLQEFAFPYLQTAMGVVVAAVLGVFFLSTHTEGMSDDLSYGLVAGVAALAVWGVLHNRAGSIPVLCSALASLLVNLLDLRYGIDRLTVVSSALVIGYTYILAREFSVSERLKRDASVRSVRLENQLLKRSINPHFLLNSLTSIIAWLKKEPARARELVESLSEEFRLISQVSDMARIPMRQELALCEAHLKIMSCRKNSRFRLLHHGLDLAEEVPPMIFHTLIENGVTHGFARKKRGEFVLSRTLLPDGVRYRMFNDGEPEPDADAGALGTGFKYIRARLEESYPGKWECTQRRVQNGFEVDITVHIDRKRPS